MYDQLLPCVWSAFDRKAVVALALLCGSDYTDGVQGVGPVTAVEVLAEFPGSGLELLINFRCASAAGQCGVTWRARLQSGFYEYDVDDLIYCQTGYVLRKNWAAMQPQMRPCPIFFLSHQRSWRLNIVGT